jgi:hypothetical protein
MGGRNNQPKVGQNDAMYFWETASIVLGAVELGGGREYYIIDALIKLIIFLAGLSI